MGLSFNSNENRITLILFLSLILYYLYYYLGGDAFLKKKSTGINKPVKNEVQLFLQKKILGFILLGIIPGILYYIFIGPFLQEFGLTFSDLRNNLLLITVLMGTIALFLYTGQKIKRSNTTVQMNYQEWNVLLFSLNVAGWVVYLAGYEFLFRGILLFECKEHFGFWPAIAVNVILYSAIHMVYGKEQAIGALLFGSLACYLTLTKQTILIPFFMHIALSLFSDYFSIKLNPALKFIDQEKLNLPKK